MGNVINGMRGSGKRGSTLHLSYSNGIRFRKKVEEGQETFPGEGGKGHNREEGDLHDSKTIAGYIEVRTTVRLKGIGE